MSTGKQIILSKADKAIFESYKLLILGLADYLGEGYEIALYSLENVNESIIKIVNGHHSGRKEGAPMTDLVLAVQDRISQGRAPGYITYSTKNKNGVPVKASMIRILGSKGQTIGLICINFYLNTPYIDVLKSLIPKEAEHAGFLPETFAEDVGDLIETSVANAKEAVAADKSILPSLANKEIVTILLRHGVFKLKDAVPRVSELLGVSKNTIYMHLRALNKN